MENKSTGTFGEKTACNFLIDKGYYICEKNWVFNHNEVDIIAEYEDFIIFIEVKTRKLGSLVPAVAAVNRKKQKGIIKVANQYISSRNLEKEARFDIITIHYNHQTYKIEHIEEAFYPLL